MGTAGRSWPSRRPQLRTAAADVLYQVVCDHFETFRAQEAELRGGEGLPGFVEQEFREVLQCWRARGSLAWARVAGRALLVGLVGGHLTER